MAERDLTAAFAAAISAGTVRPALLYEGEFVNPSGGATEYLRFWTGIGNFVWNTYTWTGAGHLLGVSTIEESAEIKAVGFSLTLSGQPAANIAVAEEGIQSGRPGKVYLAVFDAAGALILDPYLLRRGLLDVPVIDDAGETCTITVNYEDRLAILEQASNLDWTHETQQLFQPGDLGFAFVQQLQDTQIL